MQWLITIIQEWIAAQGYLTQAFFDRGDPAAADWTEFTLQADFAWHVLDCSSIVPEGAKAIVLNVGIMDNLVGQRIHIREYGNTQTRNRSEMRTQVADLFMFQDFTCSCDSQRRLEYRLSPIIWNFITIIIKGWIL